MEDDEAVIAEEEKLDVGLKKKAHKKRKKLLYQTVCKQLEFYFSDANLSRDRFLGKLIQDDPNVPLEVFMRFNKVIALVSSVNELVKALEGSEILEVSKDKRTVRRVTEVQNKGNVDECSIYVENVPPDANHEYMSNIFSEYGKVVYVSLPKFHGTHTNKGFAFVEYDTPEEAAKALQAFWDKGCCLPTHMPPEKLCSIQTFESNTDNVKSGKANEGQKRLAGKENIETEKDERRQEDHADEGRSGRTEIQLGDEGKDKPVEISESVQLEESLKCEDETKVSKSSKKRKMKDEEQSSNKAEIEERNSKKLKVDDDKIILDTDESTQAESGATENKKRHRKKKRKTKEDNNEVFADGLLILSKKEWKRLRNKYLDMQKHKMNQVKGRLYQAQSYYHKWKNNDSNQNNSLSVGQEEKGTESVQDTGRVKLAPGIIVKVTFDKPLSCVPTFKSEAKKHSCVQYVDAASGSWEAFLRCSSSSDARFLVERQLWPQMSVLEGEEENSYWEKIKRDRADKINNKTVGRTKERGKKKLLRKAEKMRGTHLLFN